MQRIKSITIKIIRLTKANFALVLLIAFNSCNFLIKEDVDKRIGESNSLQYTKNDGDLLITLNNKPILNYRYGITKAPVGVDSIFQKSGYIHPIRSLSGNALTRIQPPDHYHHYGIWGPWTRTKIGDRSVDFWNLGERQGTVLFKEFKEIESKLGELSFVAKQEHIDFGTTNENKVAIEEDLEIRVWDLQSDTRYIVDYNSTFSSPLANGILFEAYRYGGGLGFRATEEWTSQNSYVLTSGGKDRLTADGTNARWCIVGGKNKKNQKNGILFMSHPENKNHPEPMRVWPIDANNGRGDMFFEFCPIRHDPWKIEPHKKYHLKYRMVVFDGDLTAKEAEKYWRYYSKNTGVEIIKN